MTWPSSEPHCVYVCVQRQEWAQEILMQPLDGWSFVCHLFSLRPAVRSGPGSYQSTAFVLGPVVSECVEALSEQTFPSLQTLQSPGQQPHWCLDPCTLVTYLSDVDPKGSCT